MEKSRFEFKRMSSRSSSNSSSLGSDSFLPIHSSFEKPVIRLRTVVTHGVYRRVLIWAVTSVLLVTVFLYSTRDGSLHRISNDASTPSALSHGSVDVPSNADSPAPPKVHKPPHNNGIKEEHDAETVYHVNPNPEDPDQDGSEKPETPESLKRWEEDLGRMPWLNFKLFDGYFNGLKTLVSSANHVPENARVPPPLSTRSSVDEETPSQKPYYPYNSSHPDFRLCYLDSQNTIPAPDIFAYSGIPQNFPEPSMGSYQALGIPDDVCFDRFGRYGPYGFGYSKREGGSGVGQFTESSGNERVWATSGKIDYNTVDWADAQDRCYEANKARFQQVNPETNKLVPVKGKKARIAVVIRVYTGFEWTDLAILNFRALINELSLKSGGEYQVHFLLHVKDGDTPLWSDEATARRVVETNMPAEFRGMVTLWSEPQMALYYPGKFRDSYSNPSQRELGGVYRSGHWPLQIFARQHPEYEHFWNWEMDMRWVGNYYELFNRMTKWAEQQPRHLAWERNSRYFIPSYHGNWENFTATVERDAGESGIEPVLGPVQFQGRKSLRFEMRGESPMPASCDPDGDRSLCGVGEEADLITVNPIFDTHMSGWAFGLDAVGYPKKAPPPRRAAIITASRLSRRLLDSMHEQVWRHHQTMFSEMFPASIAFHHGFKAVAAPHPIYLDRQWGDAINEVFNGGSHHSTDGHGCPFDISNEHNHRGSTWYFNSKFSGMLWRRWLGYPQKDMRGRYQSTQGEDGVMQGGKNQEESSSGTGRMCLRSMLLHPIKLEHPSEFK
ncbi:unnamed protein product [Clonostachys rosea f. rosea IK726]|uniref:Major facilitator superfamily transporter n=2 Tax=Bionectria ochroleuca TaxID=29856 RepID=A0A0B7KCC9_BIOOC|nr:unnamed protein product [Clonostachys rosea f. rosea IK726]